MQVLCGKGASCQGGRVDHLSLEGPGRRRCFVGRERVAKEDGVNQLIPGFEQRKLLALNDKRRKHVGVG